MDAFDLLQISPSFAVDLSLLAKRQRDLSRALHPDKFVSRPHSERRAALGRAIEVNNAHRALKDPLRRGEILLARLGLTVEEGTEASPAPEFLMEMMEARENLRAAGRGEDVSKIESLSRVKREDIERVNRELTQLFDTVLVKESSLAETASEPQGPGASPHKESRLISQYLGELRFYKRFIDEAEALLDEL